MQLNHVGRALEQKTEDPDVTFILSSWARFYRTRSGDTRVNKVPSGEGGYCYLHDLALSNTEMHPVCLKVELFCLRELEKSGGPGATRRRMVKVTLEYRCLNRILNLLMVECVM